jgi:hypothetical protein
MPHDIPSRMNMISITIVTNIPAQMAPHETRRVNVGVTVVSYLVAFIILHLVEFFDGAPQAVVT